MNLNESRLSSAGVHMIYRLLESFRSRAHYYRHLFCVRRAVIVENLILSSRYRSQLIHVILNYVRHGVALFIGAFLALEINVGIGVVSSIGRMLRIERIAAEILYRLIVHQASQILIIYGLYALHLVRRPESVEAMHESILGFYSRKMRHCGHIHGLLRRR